MSSKSVLQERLTRMSSNSKSVKQEVSSKCVKLEVSYKSVKQSVLQECQVRVPHTSAKQECQVRGVE